MASGVSSISASARAEAPINSAELIGVVTLYIAISTIFFVARAYARFFIHQQLWWDDWTMLLAWLGTISLCTLQLVMIRYGAGVNIWEVPKHDLTQFLKLWLDIQMAARIAIFFARLSILLFYIRIFFPIGTARTIFWWIIQAVIWINILYSVSLILVLTLQCVPYHRPWGSSCVNQWLVLINASVINIISDIAVLVIPIASIIRLKTTRRRKWAIWALFAFGTLAPLASIARLAYQIPLANGENKTVIYPIVLFLATAEQTVAMIVGSAPIASGVIVAMVRRKRPHNARLQKKTLTERLWPSREARTEYAGGTLEENAAPFATTEPAAVATESIEGLHPTAKEKSSDGENGSSFGTASRTTTNHNRDTIHDNAASGHACKEGGNDII